MAGKTERWPDLGKPATKGDVLSAIVGVHGCLVDIALALSQTERGDDVSARKKSADLQESLKRLGKTIETIGGNNDAG
jgi:hypothetical protein